jgi:hypothetical protein
MRQRTPDCDMSLVHDDDLVVIDELRRVGHGGDAVSGLLIGGRIVFILAVTGNPRARRGDGSPPEVQCKDT